MEHLRNTKPFTSVPMTMRTKNGETVVLENSGAPVFDEVGSFKGYRGVLRDVSETKRTQAYLNWYAGIAKAIGENVPSPCYFVEAKNNQIIYLSHMFVELFGLGPFLEKADISSLKDTDLIKYFLMKVEDKAGFKLRPVPQHEKDIRSIDHLRLTDGRFIQRVCLFIRDSQGELLGRSIYFSNPADERLGVGPLTEDLTQSLLSDVHLGIIGVSKVGLVSYMNPTAERLVGAKLDEAGGQPLQKFVTFQNTKGLAQSDPLPLSGNHARRAFRKELFLVRRDGSVRTVECSVDLCRSTDHGLGIILTMVERPGPDEKAHYPPKAKG